MTTVRFRWRDKVAREHGWFCKWDEQRGWVECAADDPDAALDHNRAEGFIQTGTDVRAMLYGARERGTDG